MSNMAKLEVKNLTISFRTNNGAVRAVRDILLSYGKEGYEKKKQAARENAQILLDCLEESEAKTLLSEIFDLMICREN